jgi:putative tricarboxylic transport membrane protein
MRPAEAVPSVFLITVSVLVLVGSANLTYWADITPGPRFFPVWIAGISIVLSVALLLQLRRGTDTGVTELPDRSAFVRIALTIAAMAAFAIAAPLVGMVVAVVAFMLFILIGVLRQRAHSSAIAAAIIAGAIELIFVRTLKIALPSTPFL